MAIAEVLCHEMTEADIRKANGTSNDAQSGGGARDLQFSIGFMPCLDRFFPQEVTHERKTPYRIGTFEHIDESGNRTTELVRYAFQPTSSRPTEVRIAQINKLSFFRDLPDLRESDGILFMAFIRKTNGIPQAQSYRETNRSTWRQSSHCCRHERCPRQTAEEQRCRICCKLGMRRQHARRADVNGERNSEIVGKR